MTFIRAFFRTGRYDWVIFLLPLSITYTQDWISFLDPEMPALFIFLGAISWGLSRAIQRYERGILHWGLQIIRVSFLLTGSLFFFPLTMAKGFQTDPRTIKAWTEIGTVRSALSIYYGDMEGVYPSNLEALAPRYIDGIPTIKIPAVNRVILFRKYLHPPTSKVEYYDSTHKAPIVLDRDTGGWAYVRSGPHQGEVYVDCIHKNSRGVPWSAWSRD